MGGQLLDIDHGKAVTVEDPDERAQREIGEMLVIDGVELVLGQESQEMRHLDREQAIRIEELREPGNEVVDVGDLGEGVVAGDQRCPPACGSQLLPEIVTEEPRQGGYSGRLRGASDILRWLDSQHRHAGGDEVPQQVAVVAADLRDQAVGTQVQRPHHVAGITLRMFQPTRRE